MRRVLAVAALALLAAAPAPAQTRAPAKPAVPKAEPAPPPPAPPPPYEAPMLRLSELLGALAFLRDLCGEGDGEAWRAKMQQLVDVEGAAPESKARLAGAFNRGFRGYELTYRACTPAARTAIQRYLVEGGRLSRELSQRWGG
jgi:uncharacterized protein (TIGR02301 family)